MRDTEVLRMEYQDFGAVLTSGARKFADPGTTFQFHHFLVGSAPGREIKHIIFNFFHGGTTKRQIDLEWRLRHPPQYDKPEGVLARGTVGLLEDFVPVIYSMPTGVLGYHRTLELAIMEPVTANAKALLDLHFQVHFLNTGSAEEDKGIHEVPQPETGGGLRLM